MKKSWVCLFVFVSFLCIRNQGVQAQVPFLEIHHIGSGDGDATLILAVDSSGTSTVTGQRIWDTCAILIDGQRPSGGKEVWRYVRDTITARFPDRKIIDYLVASHLHLDHYGGLTGVIDSCAQHSWLIGGVVTRYQLLNYQGNATDVLDTCYSNIDVKNAYRAQKDEFFEAIGNNHIPQPTFQPLSNLFALKKFRNMSMICVAAGGASIYPGTDSIFSFLPFKTDASGNKKYYNKNENDLSYAWLITFQGFHYLTMGDLGGKKGNYVDGETPITNYLVRRFQLPATYHLCSYKVSHHGSSESTIMDFVTRNNPSLAIIPANLYPYGAAALPTQDVVTNLNNNNNVSNNTSTQINYTFIPMNPQILASYWTRNNLAYYNDVIIKIQGGPGYQQVLSFTQINTPKNLNFSYQGAPPIAVTTFTCNKGHNW